MVLLRMAIGWHLGYEGLCKLEPRWSSIGMPWSLGTAKAFSAEGYLRNSSGPLRQFFREMISDPDGLKRLDDPELVDRQWDELLLRAERHYNFTPPQKDAVLQRKTDLASGLRQRLADEAAQKKIADYKEMLTGYRDLENRSLPDPLDRQRLSKLKGQVDAARVELLGPFESATIELENFILQRLSEEQRLRPPPRKLWAEMEQLEKINLTTQWGLFLCGGLMFVGLFSRLASLGAAGFLTLFYVSLLWPGLTPMPMAEGNYLIVNKNLVELIACLLLATSPSGVWGGLDALIRGLITRPLLGIGADEVRARFGEKD